MRKAISIAILTVTFSSCITERSTNETYTLKNNSGTNVKIVPFTAGKTDSNKIIELQNGAIKDLEIVTYSGKNTAPLYIVDYFAYTDSVLVIWNDSLGVLHIPSESEYSGSRKVIDTNSTRCIGNVKQYALSQTSQKNNVTFMLTYTFTNADYEYAKE